MSGENNFNNAKKLAEKIHKNSFGETYVSNVFYYYSQEKANKITKAGQTYIKHCLENSLL